MRRAIRGWWTGAWQWLFGLFGLAIVHQDQIEAAQVIIAGCRSYITRSGHLQTVRGRKPKAITVLDKNLRRAQDALRWYGPWS